MVTDAQGRAYIGNIGFDLMGGADIAPSGLLRVDPDGRLANRRNWTTFGDPPTALGLSDALPGLAMAPDGCTLDAEGALWIADGLNGRVIRVLEGGDIVQEISLGTGVLACGLGGSDGRTLFVCAAPDFDEHARSAACEGQLLSIRVDVPHAGRP